MRPRSDEAEAFQAGMAVAGNDDMVVDGDAKDFCGICNVPGHADTDRAAGRLSLDPIGSNPSRPASLPSPVRIGAWTDSASSWPSVSFLLPWPRRCHRCYGGGERATGNHVRRPR
jgi:hypothetical protein